MSQSHGRRFEHDLTNTLIEVTPEEVWVCASGWSGNSKHGSCDVVVSVSPNYATYAGNALYAIEAKKVQAEGGKRTTVFSGSSGGESGLGEVRRLVQGTPEWAMPVLAIKFDHRKLVVIDARHLLSELGAFDCPVPSDVRLFEARLTASNNVSMRKPSLDDWESSRAADDDAVVLADELGLPVEEDAR